MTTLRSIGYITLELLLNPLQFGIPNSRLRYYLLAKRSPLKFHHVPSDKVDEVWRQIPGSGNKWTDPRLEAPSSSSNPDVQEIKAFLDVEPQDDCAISEKVLSKWGRLFDIVTPSSQRTCCFTRGKGESLRICCHLF